MPCPFPGMDPYIERPEIWPDFHDRLIGILCGMLNAVVRPRYVALTQDRLYVLESDRPIRPDVALIRSDKTPKPDTSSAAAVADPAVVFEFWREDIREPFIEIVEPASGNRVVTAVEVLSPANKESGHGRSVYLKKREEYRRSGTNLVEIDLLHEGQLTIDLSAEKLESLGQRRYVVAVTRIFPSREEIYPIPLERKLPRVAIPLDADVPDVAVDLQAAFGRCWDEGPYPELLDYENPPPGKWTAEEKEWCRRLIGESTRGA